MVLCQIGHVLGIPWNANAHISRLCTRCIIETFPIRALTAPVEYLAPR